LVEVKQLNSWLTVDGKI